MSVIDHRSYFYFATFTDPDGNNWLFQQMSTPLPGRGLSNLDVATLTDLLRTQSSSEQARRPRLWLRGFRTRQNGRYQRTPQVWRDVCEYGMHPEQYLCHLERKHPPASFDDERQDRNIG